MLQSFGASLNRGLQQLPVSEYERQAIELQRVRLAEVELPPTLTVTMQEQVRNVVAAAFISGFRLIVLISSGLAVLGGLNSFLFIGRRDKAHQRGG
jgi:hypothetical protein